MRKNKEETKIREGRGTGTGADYKPWIKIREVNSIGTASTVMDYKTGRPVELLSQGEVYYYVLRWNDTVEDIREQFLPDRTPEIADRLEIKHAGLITKDYNSNHHRESTLTLTDFTKLSEEYGKNILYTRKQTAFYSFEP